MRIPSSIMIISMVALLSACASTPQITTDYDRSANFSNYRTYGFAAIQEDGYQSLTDKYIKSAITQALEQRGYRQSDTPDLVVHSMALKQDKVQVWNSPEPAGFYSMRRGGYSGWTGYNQTLWPYTEGSLTIDLVDRDRKQLVWRGVITNTLEENQPVGQAQIQQAVEKLFTQYPYRAGE